MENKFKSSNTDVGYYQEAANKFIDSILIEWGKRAEIPNLMKELVQQAKAHQ